MAAILIKNEHLETKLFKITLYFSFVFGVFVGEAFLREEKEHGSDSITAAVLQGLYTQDNHR